MKSKKKILVTGAAGFIGRETVRQLAAAGHEVVATDIKPAAAVQISGSGVTYVQADLTDPTAAAGLFKDVRVVFHIAGICNLSTPYNRLEPVNVGGAETVSLWALQHNVDCFVHFSSTSVYGLYKDRPFSEDSPCQPGDSYGRSKLAGENIIRKRMAEGLKAVIVRPCTVYGPGCNDGAGKVFSRPGKIAGIPGSGRQKLANVRVEDAAGAAIYLSTLDSAAGNTYNLADDSPVELEEALITAAETFNSSISRLHIPLGLLKIIARIEGFFAALKGRIPDLEYEAVKYLYNDYIVDNSRLQQSGYRLQYPDFKESMRQIKNNTKEKVTA